MTDRFAPAERLSEVARLATLLADRVLEAQIMSRPIPDAQIRALLDAALVLEEHSLPLPPLLMQILHEVDKDPEHEATEGPSSDGVQDSAGQEKVRGFTRLLRTFRGKA